MIYKSRNIDHIFLLSIFVVIINHSLISGIFTNTPLIVWKQVIGGFFSLMFLHFIIKNKYRIDNKYSPFIPILLLLVLHIFMGNSLLAITYNITFIMGILYFWVFTFLLKITDERINFIINTILIITVLTIIFILIDGQYRIFLKFNAIHQIYSISDNASYRAAGTLGSATLVFYGVSILPLLLSRLEVKRKIVIIWFAIFLANFALLMSGSRAGIILFNILVFYVVIQRYKFQAIPIFITLLSIFITLELFGFLEYLDRLSSINDRYESGNFTRLAHYSYFLSNPQLINIFGHGGGNLMSGELPFPSRHFESTLISLVYEYGIFGAICLYVFLYIYPIVNTKREIRLWFMLLLIHSIFVPLHHSFVVYTMMGLIYGLSLNNSDLK